MIRILILGIILGFSNSAQVSKNSERKPVRQIATDALPKNVEAERAVLGAIVLNPDSVLRVMSIVRDRDFFLRENMFVYRAIESLVASGKPVDTVTILEELEAGGGADRAGGAAYVSALADGIPRSVNIEQYAQIVREKSQLRELMYECEEISRLARESSDPSEIIETAVGRMLALASRDSSAPRILSWQEASQIAMSQIDSARANPESVFRAVFGLTDLDRKTSGLRKKELALIVGATSHGKSRLAQHLAVATEEVASGEGIIFSAEMAGESIAVRQMAADSDTYFYRVRRPELLDEQRLQNLRFASLRERKIALVDSGITPSRVFAMSEARKRSTGLDFVIVDYDQLVIEAGLDPDSDSGEFFRHQAAFITQAQNFAKRLDVLFVILAQQRKMPAGFKPGRTTSPQLDDIFGSSAMRNHPDVIIWIVRDFFIRGMDKRYEDVAHAYVLKARNGSTGSVKLKFDNKLVRFEDDDTPEEEEASPDSES